MNIYIVSIIDSYYIFFYYIQYYLSNIMISYASSSVIFLLLIFFFIGFITIFTPCFISLVPIAMSYFSNNNKSTKDISLFLFGLITNLIIFIYVGNFFASSVSFNKLPIFSNLFILIISLNLMNIINFSDIFSKFIFFPKVSINQNIQNYGTGLIIGFSSLPCNTSILFIVSFLLKYVNNSLLLFFYILAYLLGFFIPLFLIFAFKLHVLNARPFPLLWNLASALISSCLFIISLFSILRLSLAY
uniref:Thiol:disulfide interchange protein n=1 Tax=Polysiphonia sertularioides TaxID=945028 RepID=A0A1Z1M9G8_9FLOR|nr:thiol:disulfide interchange protein [Polysiphonia sertularioides]ARW62415.1 thiol:disulfide interchange protein [Polysiphonia sertularioides]